MDTTFSVKTSGFEGPFNLLLGLVEERKLFISEISLAEVTDDFLKYINEREGIDPAQISSFMIVAATLILIKSKSLLPGLELTDEEKGDIKSLETRLKLYDLFAKQAVAVKNNFGRRIIFAPEERRRETMIFLPDEQITRERMMILIREVLGRIPQKLSLPEVEVKKVISLEEMIERLTERVARAASMSFREFSKQGRANTKEARIEVIVSFLAMLELVRQGILDAIQHEANDDILINKLETLNN